MHQQIANFLVGHGDKDVSSIYGEKWTKTLYKEIMLIRRQISRPSEPSQNRLSTKWADPRRYQGTKETPYNESSVHIAIYLPGGLHPQGLQESLAR
jgi:hypothetical protein